ncbi:MAG: four helix bundle protein [Bacteroidia bacterium]|nr:four helix bundle protein [Bacteroidia bacterium]
MSYVKSFKELEVYKLARELAKEIFILSRTFPMEEKYSLTDQIRRSSRSIGAQIAEAWGKRKYEKHFISKLTDSDAEQLETQHWLETAHECEYLNNNEADILLKKCESIGKMLQTMMDKSSSFCGKI